MSSRAGSLPAREAMVASQQAHIDDLIQRNRTLDHTISKLQKEISAESARSTTVVQGIRTQWSQEREDWKEGCETLQACHRLVQLRTAVQVGELTCGCLEKDDLIRKEKLARLQRDYIITLYQVKETELEDRVALLEEMVEEARWEWKREVGLITIKCADYASETAVVSQSLDASYKDIEKLEVSMTLLREEMQTLRTKADNASAKLERTQLELDGALISSKDIQKSNLDLEKSNAELKRQLERWKTLENKGGTELKEERQSRLDLQVKVQQLEDRLAADDKSDEVDKLNGKIARLRETLVTFKSNAQVDEEEISELKAHNATLQKSITKLQTENDKLKAGKKASRPPAEEEGEEEEVLEEILAPAPPTPEKKTAKEKPKPKPRQKAKELVVLSGTEDGEATAGPSKRGKVPDMPIVVEEEEEDAPNKTKGTARGKKVPTTIIIDDDGDTEPPQRTKTKGKRKVDDMEVDDVVEEVGSKKKSKDVAAAPLAKKGRGGSIQPKQGSKPRSGTEDGEVEQEVEAAAKKKRKINVFAGAKDAIYQWDGINLGGNDLGIPTELSPVKEGELVPNRSASGILSRLGSSLGSFGGYRRQ